MKKILMILLVAVVGLFAIDKNSVISELSCKTYSYNDDMAGIYKYFDSAKKLWFLYMPKLNYLLVHETGKTKTSEGAIVVPIANFSSINSEKVLTFGTYSGSVSNVSGLSNKTFSINDDMAGIYKYFDPAKKLWFLYMPKLNYLLVHETGKTKTSEGAITIPVSDFESINVLQDPFGNSLGSIEFIAKGGCSSSSSSSSSEASSSSSSSSSSYYPLTSDSLSGVSTNIETDSETDTLYFCPDGRYKADGQSKTDATDTWSDKGTWSISDDGQLILDGENGTFTVTFDGAPMVHETGALVGGSNEDEVFTINSITNDVTNSDCETSSSSSSSSASDIEYPPSPPDLENSSSSSIEQPPSVPTS